MSKSKILFISGVTGATIKIDSNGDSEGNFSVLALKPYKLSKEVMRLQKENGNQERLNR